MEVRHSLTGKWLLGSIVKCSFPDTEGVVYYDIKYEIGSFEARVDHSRIRHPVESKVVDGVGRAKTPKDAVSPGASNGNPFARQISPSAPVANPFSRQLEDRASSPLPAVKNSQSGVKTPSVTPVKTISATSSVEGSTNDWDASLKSATELPSPFKHQQDKTAMSPVLLKESSRAARTAPGVSRVADGNELFPDPAMAKRDSRRDVRTAGNIPDLHKTASLVVCPEPARRKGSRRGAGRVARAVSEHALDSSQSQAQIPNRRSSRVGPSQILRDARANSELNSGDASSSLVWDDEDSYYTKYTLPSSTSKQEK